MSDIGKGMLIILVILYIVSPIDFAPGPVDDAIVLLLGLAAVAYVISFIKKRKGGNQT